MAADGPDEDKKIKKQNVDLMLSEALTLTRHSPLLPRWTELFNFVISFATVTCGWRPLRGYNHWDEILPGDHEAGPLFLGGLPIETKIWCFWKWIGDHAEKLNAQCEAQDHQLGLVVSMVRDFEAKGSGIVVYPVSPEGWARRGVEYAWHPMEDFTVNIQFKELKDIVDIIHRRRTRGIGPEPDAVPDGRKGAYVHCKAGVGRSLLVTWAYLVLHCNMTVAEAERLLREKRPQVAITNVRREYIQQFADHYLGKEQFAIAAESEESATQNTLPTFTKSRSEGNLLYLVKKIQALQLEDKAPSQSRARCNSFTK